MLETAQPSGGAATRQSAAQAEQYKVDLHSQVGLASRRASDGVDQVVEAERPVGGRPVAAEIRAREVVAPDGVRLHVREAGPETAPAILFIHGWSQSWLSWVRQLESELAERFRLVAFDLRGHGMSDEPHVPEAYTETRRWADDVDALITELELDRPILVGWSFGGYVTCDYIRAHGQGALAGLNLVDILVSPFVRKWVATRGPLDNSDLLRSVTLRSWSVRETPTRSPAAPPPPTSSTAAARAASRSTRESATCRSSRRRTASTASSANSPPPSSPGVERSRSMTTGYLPPHA
jgi:pimeloyl-ACP methyl ester carboxylesterase